MILPIVAYDTPVLREKGVRVESFGPELRAFAQDLEDTLRASEVGIGLAAQQIGRALQICIVDMREIDSRFTYTLDGGSPPLGLIMPMFLVNPVLDFPEGKPNIVEEGCLSFPELRGPVLRQELVSVRYQDLSGAPHHLVCDGIFGRCIQHEVDHLNGVLFIDRMSKTARAKLDSKLEALAKRTRALSGMK
jgi:peptide deformylase